MNKHPSRKSNATPRISPLLWDLWRKPWFLALDDRQKQKRIRAKLKQVAKKRSKPVVIKARVPRKKRKSWVRRPQRAKGAKALTFTERLGVRSIINHIPGQPDTSVIQLAGAEFDWLTAWNSVKGNKKTPNPFSFTHKTSIAGSGTQVADNGAGSYTITSGVIKPYPAASLVGFDATCYNEALSRLYDQLRGDVDISIDLAESHKTRKMMSDSVKAMRNAFITLRKMRRSNPRDWGNLWLEFTYGWKPLASTIYNGGKRLLTEPSGPRKLVLKASAKTNDESHSSAGNGTTAFKLTRDNYVKNRVRLVCSYSLSGSAIESLAGFTSLNPVSVAWELTPYSFVADWFVDIGGYLRNFESACIYRNVFTGGYSSSGYSASIAERYSQNDRAFDGSTFTLNTLGTATENGFRRALFSVSPLPRAPKFDPRLGWRRLVSGGALLGQMIKSLEHQRDYGNVPLTKDGRSVIPSDKRIKWLDHPKGLSLWDAHMESLKPRRR